MHYTCMCVNEKKSQQFLTHTVFVKHSNDYEINLYLYIINLCTYTYMIILSQCSSCSLHSYLSCSQQAPNAYCAIVQSYCLVNYISLNTAPNNFIFNIFFWSSLHYDRLSLTPAVFNRRSSSFVTKSLMDWTSIGNYLVLVVSKAQILKLSLFHHCLVKRHV